MQVSWVDKGDHLFDFKTDAAIFRYWDTTVCIEFGFRMAAEALDVELRQETRFLARHDRVLRAGDAQVDVRGSDLATLVIVCLGHAGVISQKKRKRFADRVPEAVFNLIESVVLATLEEEAAREVKSD